VVEQISERARQRPDAVALEYGSRRVSYGELLTGSRRLAARLAALGAGPDEPVAVLLPRGVEAVTAILGTLLSGAGYLPLDPEGPESRNAEILKDARPPLLLTNSRYAERLDRSGTPRVVLLDEESEAGPEEPPLRAPDDPASEEHLAYVIYTSGSTGRPKGVMVERGALAHFVAGARRRYGLEPDDRVLQFAPLHFDASVEETFLTLCAGATLVLRTDEMLQSVARLLAACEECGVTVLDLPTAFWHEVVYSVSTGAAALPACMRTVVIGGEAALPERVARWRRAVGDSARLLNTYGPTEATVVATAATMNSEAAAGEEVPIGRPLPGVRAAVLDTGGRPVPRGEVGELYLAGGGLARGYLGRPDLDAGRFVTLDRVPGRPRAYRTGDLVRQREDGQLVFVGRADDEFKISGHRVDPAEVESALLRHPSVREAAVAGEVLEDGARRLAAHVVAATSPAPSPADLRRHLRFRLPAAVVPAAFKFVDRLPRTTSGKIDRSTLRAAAGERLAGEVTAPAAGLERAVLIVWEEVLGTSGLSARDDFFELGGQSLQAIQASNRLGIELGCEVPVALLFRHPTAAELARALDQTRQESTKGAGTEPGRGRNGLP
jgi:nonribosomal peptide synthetase MxcG